MNTDTEIAFIDPWQARHYAALLQPTTLNGSARYLDCLLDHRDLLRAAGDEKAVAGIRTPIAVNIVELASIDATTPRILDRKVAILAAQSAAWADQPMIAAMIEAAVMADAQGLGFDRATEQRLRAKLRGAA